MAGRQPSNDTRSRFERWLPHPWLTLVLVLLWILLLNSFSVGGLLMGVVLGVLISHLTSQFWPERPPIKSLGKAFSYLGLVAWDVVVANMQVTRIILFRRADSLVIPHEIARIQFTAQRSVKVAEPLIELRKFITIGQRPGIDRFHFRELDDSDLLHICLPTDARASRVIVQYYNQNCFTLLVFPRVIE